MSSYKYKAGNAGVVITVPAGNFVTRVYAQADAPGGTVQIGTGNDVVPLPANAAGLNFLLEREPTVAPGFVVTFVNVNGYVVEWQTQSLSNTRVGGP